VQRDDDGEVRRLAAAKQQTGRESLFANLLTSIDQDAS